MYLQYPGGGVGSPVPPGTTTVRENIELIGTYDGTNRDFFLPEPAINNYPYQQIKVYHNGRRLLLREFQVSESVPGGGYDSVRMLVFAPHSTSILQADYHVNA